MDQGCSKLWCAWLVFALGLAACGDDASARGETAWLRACGSGGECATGHCIQDVCSRACALGDDAACGDLGAAAMCLPLEGAQGGMCDRACDLGADCGDLGSAAACVEERCRYPWGDAAGAGAEPR